MTGRSRRQGRSPGPGSQHPDRNRREDGDRVLAGGVGLLGPSALRTWV